MTIDDFHKKEIMKGPIDQRKDRGFLSVFWGFVVVILAAAIKSCF